MQPPLASLRGRLLLLVLAALLPPIGLAAYEAIDRRAADTSAAKREAKRLADLAAAGHGRQVEEAEQLLVALAQLPAVRRPSPQCGRLLASFRARLPQYENLGVVGRDGLVTCSALPTRRPVDLSDRGWFRRALATRRFAVGDFQIGRITHRATVNFGLPILEGGRVRAVVFAALGLRSLEQLAREAPLPRGSSVLVLDGNGTVLARVPSVTGVVGRRLTEGVVKEVLGRREGTAEATGLDGVRRLYGFAVLPGSPPGRAVHLAIGLPKSAVVAAPERQLARDMLVLGLVALLTLVAGVFLLRVLLARPVEALAGTATRLAAGDLAARARIERGPSEIVALASALDEMAATLERRTQELERLNQELERRVAERTAELARTLVQLQAVLEATDEGIRFVDTEGKTLLANQTILDLADNVFHQPRGDSIYRDARPVAAQMADPERYLAEIERIEADPDYEGVQEFEHVPTRRTFRRYTAPVRDPAGELLGRVIVLRDVTEQREAERLKDELVATVSHELRTPLASILGFAELLAERDYDEATRRRFLGTIRDEARRLADLVNDFLDLQRVESARFELSPETVELEPLLRELVETTWEQSERHALELAVPAGLAVVADRAALRRAIGNLLSNAVKYSPDGGRVGVTAEQAEGAVRISVSDEGLGIPREQQHRVFERFFRAESADTREIGGTGLGLALVKEIVEAHGGRVGFVSEEGAGSTFWLELPAQGPPGR